VSRYGLKTAAAAAMVTRASAMAGALAAVAAAAALAGPAGPASASPAAWAGPAASTGAWAGPASAPGQAVLLNGDRVLLNPVGAPGPGVILPPAHGPLGAVMSWSVGDTSYDVPYAALPYLGRGLGIGLFDTSLLRAREHGGRLPVRISYHGRVPAVPGITVTRSGGGTAAGYLTASSAQTFDAALARQYAADHGHASYGTDGMFAAGTSITLAGTASSAPARPALPVHTVTFRATDLAGNPDTGGFVYVFDVSDTRVPPAKQVFSHGVGKLSLPQGDYFALAVFGAATETGPVRTVVLPQFGVTGNTTVAVHETAASSRLTMVTPRPTATPVDSDVWFERTGATGPPWVLEQSFPDSQPLWYSPTHIKPTVGKLWMSVNQHLESPPGSGTPYEYTLSFTDRSGLIPAQRYVACPQALATVQERFYQAVNATGEWAFNGSFPGTNANNNADWFGFIEPDGPSLKLPGQLTEYAGGTGSARMEWTGQYAPRTGLPTAVGGIQLLRPGQHLTDNWSAYPLHPGVNTLLTSLPNMFWDNGANIPSAVRAGNTLQLEVDPFDDNQPGDQIGLIHPSGLVQTTGTYQVDQNGTKVGGGNAVPSRGFGPFYTQVALSAKPSAIRFSLDYTRTSEAFPLSTATSTVWTWHSAPVTGGRVPPGWSCVQYTYQPRGCAAQPMMTLWYAVAHLDLSGTAPAGRQSLRVSAGHIQAAAASKITKVSVSVSCDGGKTWQPATVTGSGGNYTASFSAPAGSTVSLRTNAADAAGGSITETITSAYRVAS
jgi:hypothetical protein